MRSLDEAVCQRIAYTVIRSFKSKALAELWSTGRAGKIDARMQRRVLIRLDRLNVAVTPEEMNLPGFNFHALKGLASIRYTVHVNGPWCITFEFREGDAYRVDFEQYH
jgi:proteic killer suppression protein